MADNDPILDASKELYAATQSLNLPPNEKQKLTGFSNLVVKNRQLLSLPVKDARNEFLKLDEDIQATLKKFNPDADWAKDPDTSFFGTIKENVVEPVIRNISIYSSRLTEPYRAIRTKMVENVSWDEAWETARDGNALFDKQREIKVDNYYEAPVAKIAKQISTGKTIGEVLATLQTPEEFDAMINMLNGDKMYEEAIADYDTAKISIGRDLFYEAFDVDPGEFGANRFAFNRFSGAADLITQIAFDPITYIPVAGQGYKIAQLSILKIAKQAALSGELGKFSVEKAFTAPIIGAQVTRFFDTVGPLIKKYKEGNSEEQKEAFSLLTRNFGGDIKIQAINDLAKHDVFDAVSAQNFLAQADNAMALINGKSTGAFPTLPTYSVIRQTKDVIKASVQKATGLNKKIDVKGFGIEDNIYSFLDNMTTLLNDPNVDPKDLEAARTVINKMQGTFGRFAKNWEISPGFRSLRTGIKYFRDGTSVDEGLGAIKQVVGLARVAGFSRAIADDIGLAWAKGNQAQRIKLRDGIVASAAHSMGLSATDSGREALKRTLSILKDEQYAASQKVTKEYLDSLGNQKNIITKSFNIDEANLTDDIYINPSTDGGNVSRAVADWQLADEVTIPPIHEWYREAYRSKNWVHRSLGTAFNNKVSQAIVDAWSFLTLLPRLGIRSVIEEVMLFGFVAPTQTVKALFTNGFNASRQLRRITNNPDSWKKGFLDAGALSLPMRAWYSVFQKGLTKELAEAAKDGKKLHELMAIAMLNSHKFLKGKFVEKQAKWSRDFVRYGYGTKLYEDVTVGASAGNRIDIVSRGHGSPEEVARLYGDVAPFNIDLVRMKKEIGSGGAITNVPIGNGAYYMHWTENAVKNIALNGDAGKAAVLYMDDIDTAVVKIREILDADPTIAKRYANAYGDQTIDHQRLALKIYLKASEIFRRQDGSINPNLINIVRKKRTKADGTIETYLDTNFSVDELKKLDKTELPENVLGRMYVPIAYNQEGIIQKLTKYGYAWMDRQVATLAREPLFHSNYFFYRKQLADLEDAKYNQLINKGFNEESAREISSAYATHNAMELATKRTLDFVDNPNIRTNMAWSLRNFARFYRATEDFYRRVYRAGIKNPQSIVRLRLASDALDHSGFVYNDENDDKYFIFPTDEIFTATIAPVTKLITGKTLQTPMPLEFTGKIKMITPSLDPQSSIPTFSGPLAGISFLTLQKLMPNFMGPVKDSLIGVTLGPRSVNARWTDVILPSNVRRAVDALNQDERDSQFASAARKAIIYKQATGEGLPLNATEEQKLQYRQEIEGIAANIVVTRFFLGLLSPVAPGIGFGKDLPAFLKDAGNVNFKSEFNKLVNEIAATGEPDAYNIALQKWAALKPGLLAYTIGETDANKVATIKKTKQAADWVRKNRGLISKYPEGSGFFIPYTGDFNFNDYTFLKREGYTESVPVEEFLKRVTVAEDKEAYYALKESFDTRIESAGAAPLKASIRKEWESAKEDFLIDRPLLVQDLETRQSRQQIINSINDLRTMIDKGDAPSSDLTRKYKEMISIYDSANNMLELITSDTKVQRNQKEIIRQSAYSKIQEIAAGDPQAEMAVRVLFNRLLGV